MTEYPKQRDRSFNMESSPFELVLFNDEYHDFDFVIEKLKQHCGHTDEQAEQCAIIAHQNGECSVLMGSEERIDKAYRKLAFEGLIVDARKVTV